MVAPGLLIAGAALVVEQGSWGARASAVAVPGARARARQRWRTGFVAPGLRCARPHRVGPSSEPAPPALRGGFLTSGPPGRS